MKLLVGAAVLLFCIVPAYGDIKPRYISDEDLRNFFTSVLDRDESSAWRTVRWDLQERSPYNSTTDLAPRPLLKVDPEAYKIPTVALLARFYDNYIPDSTKNEEVTPEERKEEEAFMNAVLNTTVMDITRTFLKSKGMAAAESPSKFRDYLKKLWFTLYSRGDRKKGSSAFEHIFLGELKNGQVSGLHNWLFVAHQEKAGHFNYYGWSKKIFFNQKTSQGPSKQTGVLKLKYAWNNLVKPAGSMFVATSPELEIAIYTVCSLARPNDRCNLSYGTKTFHIQTYLFSYQNNTLISSAYPQI